MSRLSLENLPKIRRRNTIPILMYHRIVQAPLKESRHGVWVTSEKFEKQLGSLRTRGYSTITFQDYGVFLSQNRPLPAKPIILTFDDGYEDNYTLAFPLLQRFGFTAVIFAVTAEDRRTNFWDPGEPQAPLLNPSQMMEMCRHGIEFGSHTVTHANLANISVTQVKDECGLSKEMLQQVLGNEVISFAYPYGKLTAQVKSIVAETGYQFAAATDSGPLSLTDDWLQMRRIQVFPWTNSFGFWKKTQPWYLKYKISRDDIQHKKAF